MDQRTGLFREILSAILKDRARRLPVARLRSYVEAFFNRKEVFLESASRFGTPQYFFDEPAFLSRIGLFRKAFTGCIPRFKLFYAMKSNSFPGIARQAVAEGLGLDVSSGIELSLALAIGCKDIIFSGPGKTEDELHLAAAHRDRVTILMDSGGEMERLGRIVQERGERDRPLGVGLRIMGTRHGIWEKFGVPIEEIPPLMKRVISVPGLYFRGIQFHTSWNLDPRAQVEMIREIGSSIRDHVPKERWKHLQFLDIGGGYWPEIGEWFNPENTLWGKLIRLFSPGFEFRPGHYYRPARPIEDFAREISKAVSQSGPPLTDMEVWMEPGRWLCTPAMHILLSVVDRKSSTVAITDGGINLLGWERPLHDYIPVLNLSSPSPREIPLTVFGSLCTPLDVWGTSVWGDGISVGDVLLIPDQGAYTYSLRQSFIKPKARVVRSDGSSLREVEHEEPHVSDGEGG